MIHSGISVFRTPWDKPKVSELLRCPDFPGQLSCKWPLSYILINSFHCIYSACIALRACMVLCGEIWQDIGPKIRDNLYKLR